jgi:O-antigen ligase
MRNVLNVSLLTLILGAVLAMIVAFGGAAIEYAAPAYAMLLAAGILWAIKLVTLKRTSLVWSPMHLCVVVFVAYAATRAYFSPIEYDSRIGLIQVLAAGLAYFVAAFNLYRTRDRVALVCLLMLLVAVESAYSLWQVNTRADVVLHLGRPEQYNGRGSGTFVCPNHLGSLLAAVFAMTVARVALHRLPFHNIQNNAIYYILTIYTMLACLSGIYSTFSRGSWLALGAGMVVFIGWVWKSKTFPPRVVDAIIIAILVSVTIVLIGFPSVRERVLNSVDFRIDYTFDDSPVDVRDRTMAGRTEMWRTTLAIIRDHPLWGTGPLTWQWFHLQYRTRTQLQPEYAHNDYLQLASEYGLAGLIIVLAGIVVFFREAFLRLRVLRDEESRAFVLGGTVAVTVFLAHALLDFNLHIPGISLTMATLAGMVIAIRPDAQSKSRHEMPRLPKYALAAALAGTACLSAWLGTQTVIAQQKIIRAELLEESLDGDAAVELYQQAISIDPKNPLPHKRIGDIFLTRATFHSGPDEIEQRRDLARQAAQAYRQSVSLNPRQSETLAQLAAACQLAGDIAGARDAFNKALAVDPNGGFLHLRLGVFYRDIGEDELSRQAFEKANSLPYADATTTPHLNELRPRRP